MSPEFACFGIDALGQCSYDPSHPTIYISIGNMISALGFMLAAQQLIKPLYRYRLKAYGLSLSHLSAGIFIGFLFTVIAAILPSLPVSREYIFEYPIFWELAAATLILLVYGLTTWLILRPVKITKRNVVAYVQSAASFLSEANDEERVRFAYDLSYNVTDLFKYASLWDKADGAFTGIEMDRLKAAGKPQSFMGPPPICPFYLFTHRKELEKSTIVRSFLLILADPKFCLVLVRDTPWHTAHLLQHISKKHLHTRVADNFIQEIALQAILHEDSMMSREVGYVGFAHAPLLAESLFSNWHMLHRFRPLSKVSHSLTVSPSERMIDKLNLASQLMMECALDNEEYWDCSYIFDVQETYKSVSRGLASDKKRSDKIGASVSLHMGIDRICKMLVEHFATMNMRRYKALFRSPKDRPFRHIVDYIANIGFDALCSISRKFDFENPDWSFGQGLISDLFPVWSDVDDGLNPLQQHLFIKFLEKLDDNLRGYYPALLQLLLAVLGPYNVAAEKKKNSAYFMLKDAVYFELKAKLAALYKKDPEKFKDYIPSNVTYDPINNMLTHTYRFGNQIETRLDKITPVSIDPYDHRNWTLPQNKIISILKNKSF